MKGAGVGMSKAFSQLGGVAFEVDGDANEH